jgi:hypothetical protein
MDAEKDLYEAVHGPIPNKGEYLRLVLNHEQFSWLRPISQFIVQIDEVPDEQRTPACGTSR